ncbi:MAG: OmpA family protein [Pseudomonadota bacterium]
MRGFFGVVVLALGMGALGWWARHDHAADIESGLQAAADRVAAGATHEVSIRVSGRDLTITGTADTEKERSDLVARLEAIDGQRVVRDALEVLPTARPYTFLATGSEAGRRIDGYAPNAPSIGALRALFADADGDVSLASGAPEGWMTAIEAGAEAAFELKTFELGLEDQFLRLEGLAATPVEEAAARAALEAVPAGFGREIVIDLEDDGRPFALSITYAQGQEAVAAGKLPATMTVESLSPLEASVATSGLEIARIPSADGLWPSVAGTFVDALAALKTGRLELVDRQGIISGVGTRAGIARAEMTLKELPEGYTVKGTFEVFDDGAPMRLAATRPDQASLSGKLPFGTTPDMFGLESFFEDQVRIAEIDARSPGFLPLAVLGLEALHSVGAGKLIVEDGVPPRLSLMGEVNTPSDIAALESRMADAPGTVELNIAALDDGLPLRLEVTKAPNGTVVADGKLPTSSLLDFDALPRAGLPIGPAEFDDAALAGLAALDALSSGEVAIAGTTLSLTGKGTRAEIASALDRLAALPASFQAVTDLKPVDDGLPLGLTAEKTAETILLFGKMPFGAEPSSLGLDAFGEAMIVSEVDANAPDFTEAAQTGLRALAALEDGRLVVQDAAAPGEPPRITLSGGVSRAGLDQVNAAFGTLADGIAPVIDVVFADDGTPMRLEAIRDGGGTRFTGKLPFGSTAEELDLDVLPAGAEIAEIDARDADFLRTTAAGLRALAILEGGTLTSVDDPEGTKVTLIGIARTPVEAAAAREAAGGADVTLTLLDDGTPPAFEITVSPASGAVVTGKLPDGLSATEISNRLGLDVKDGARAGFTGAAGAYLGQIAPLAGWLPETARLSARYDATGLADLTVAPAPGVDPELLAAGLEADTGLAPQIEAPALRAPGAERVNAFSGQTERFSGAAWLPVYTFIPTVERCDAQSQAILAGTGVGFVSGSARLDARAHRAINALAATALHCLSALPALRIDVGGHTDAEGDEDANLNLSQARAEAVAAALVTRGVPAAALTARGFGETEPVAPNDTAEGRAANRRTTLSWSTRVNSE